MHKLYTMVRSGQRWELGEPELNDRGQPVIHNIASKLGCIRLAADLDSPVHSVFPEDEAGLVELTAQLKAMQEKAAARQSQQQQMQGRTCRMAVAEADSDLANDQSDATELSLSPQSPSNSDFEVGTPNDSANLPFESPTLTALFPSGEWGSATPQFFSSGTAAAACAGGYMNIDLLNQGLLESSFGTLKPHMLSCPKPEVMMGVGDPMIYSGCNGDSVRL